MVRYVVLAALASVGFSGCMLKSVHCKFVGDVGHSTDNYAGLATRSGDLSDQADAKQLKNTVTAEQAECK